MAHALRLALGALKDELAEALAVLHRRNGRHGDSNAYRMAGVAVPAAGALPPLLPPPPLAPRAELGEAPLRKGLNYLEQALSPSGASVLLPIGTDVLVFSCSPAGAASPLAASEARVVHRGDASSVVIATFWCSLRVCGVLAAPRADPTRASAFVYELGDGAQRLAEIAPTESAARVRGVAASREPMGAFALFGGDRIRVFRAEPRLLRERAALVAELAAPEGGEVLGCRWHAAPLQLLVAHARQVSVFEWPTLPAPGERPPPARRLLLCAGPMRALHALAAQQWLGVCEAEMHVGAAAEEVRAAAAAAAAAAESPAPERRQQAADAERDLSEDEDEAAEAIGASRGGGSALDALLNLELRPPPPPKAAAALRVAGGGAAAAAGSLVLFSSQRGRIADAPVAAGDAAAPWWWTSLSALSPDGLLLAFASPAAPRVQVVALDAASSALRSVLELALPPETRAFGVTWRAPGELWVLGGARRAEPRSLVESPVAPVATALHVAAVPDPAAAPPASELERLAARLERRVDALEAALGLRLAALEQAVARLAARQEAM
jgi:hypothetical protein